MPAPENRTNTADLMPPAQSFYGGQPGTSTPYAKGATAGIPGTFTPAGSTPPPSSAEAAQWGLTASPATAWTTGQFVQGSTAGAPGRMCWTGSAWVGGAAP